MMINKSIRRIRWIIWVLPILLIIISLCCPIEAAVYEVYLPEVSYGPVGDTVLIPVNINTVEGLEAWYIGIVFNPDVLYPTSTTIVDSTLTEFYHVEFNLIDPIDEDVLDKAMLKVAGVVKLDQDVPAPTGEGALFYIEFDVMDSVAAATDIDIVIEPDPGADPPPPEIVAGPKGVFYAETVHYTLAPIARAYRINPGVSITIPVKINNVEDLQAWNLSVSYPSSIVEFTGISTTGLTEDYDYLEWNATAGSIQVAGIVQDAPAGGTGKFLNFKFKGLKTGSGNIIFSAPSDQGNQFGPVDVFEVEIEVKKPYAPPKVVTPITYLSQIFKGPQQLPFFTQYYNAYQYQVPRFFAPPAYPTMFYPGAFPYYAFPIVQYAPRLTRFPLTFLSGRIFTYGQFY